MKCPAEAAGLLGFFWSDLPKWFELSLTMSIILLPPPPDDGDPTAIAIGMEIDDIAAPDPA
jgi:hypothetical protein